MIPIFAFFVLLSLSTCVNVEATKLAHSAALTPVLSDQVGEVLNFHHR